MDKRLLGCHVRPTSTAFNQQELNGGLVFIVTYSYSVPESKIKEHLSLQKKVKAIYLNYGCLSYEVFEKAEKDGEWMEIGRFQNKSHFKKVIAQVDKDPEIAELFRQFCSIVDVEKNSVITNEFVKRI